MLFSELLCSFACSIYSCLQKANNFLQFYSSKFLSSSLLKFNKPSDLCMPIIAAKKHKHQETQGKPENAFVARESDLQRVDEHAPNERRKKPNIQKSQNHDKNFQTQSLPSLPRNKFPPDNRAPRESRESRDQLLQHPSAVIIVVSESLLLCCARGSERVVGAAAPWPPTTHAIPVVVLGPPGGAPLT